MSAPKPPYPTYRPLKVFPPASRCVTMLVAGNNPKDAPIYVEWSHHQFNRLRLTQHLYQTGELSEFFGATA